MLTLIVLAKNEQHNLEACLESAAGVDEIIVIDDLSEDDTVQIAENKGAKVFSRAMDNYSAQRNFALSKVPQGWTFFLDADERFSPTLLAGLKKHMSQHPGEVGTAVRKNFAFGRRHRFGPLKPDRVARLYPENSVKWVGDIHEKPVFNCPAKPLDGYLLHLTYRDWNHYLDKLRRYAEYWAQEAARHGKKSSPTRALLRSWANFFKMFFINFGILGGPVAWALCYYNAGYTLTKYLRLAEINGQTSDGG